MKILIADDDAISRRFLEVSLIRSGYETAVAADGLEALSLLDEKDSPRLAVLDWMMPRLDGLGVCESVRRRASDAYVYIILLTAKGRREEIIKGLEAGADDYLTKPFDLDELKARLRTGCRILDLQDQLVSARDRLRIEATHDSLTHLWNRGAILDILRNELARCRRSGSPSAVMMADLDHFKSINDTYGHPSGDIVLREAADRMQQSIRGYDSIGRYGGEEFLIVAPGCEPAEANLVANRLKDGLSGKVIQVNHADLAVTVSLGVATTNGEVNVETLLRLADEALYDAKRNGRNLVAVKSL